jgi:hypothetical protein
MNHPPNVQIDDFGVWAVELDVGVELDRETVAVGHDGPGNGTCSGWGGKNLIEYLVAIRNTLAMHHRPVFLYLEPKSGDDWPTLDPNECNDRVQKFELALRAVKQVFGENVIELYKFVDEHNGGYPTVPEMAGKAIIYFPAPDYSSDNPDAVCRGNAPLKPTLLGFDGDDCQSRGVVQQQRAQIFRVDQYQADWTFDYGVPPNPLIVDSMAQPPYPAPSASGDTWDCENGDVSHGEIVGEQGTWQFPFKTIGRAVTRAEGTTPPRQVGEGIRLRESTRAGVGWIVLIKPGTYLESFKIDTPLTLQRDNGDGPVVIIGQRGRIVRSLWITFGTRNEGKDADTGLTAEVRAANGRVLARYQQRRDKEYGRFFTHTEQLQIDSPVFDAEMTSAVLTVDINPRGDDAWEFDWQLDGTWSDGQPFSDREIDIGLDEDQTHYQKVLAI